MTAPMAAGRPTKLTPELTAKLADLIASSAPIEVAALAVGISDRTFREWMAKGKEQGEGDYHDFRAAIDQANALSETGLVLLVSAATQNRPPMAT